MRTLLQDLRYAVRVLAKRPAFTAVAVVTLALGVGANVAVFSVFNGVLLRPPPFKDPERVVTLWQNDVKGGVAREDVAPANFLDWRERSRSFAGMAAAEPYSHRQTGEGEPVSFKSWLVSEGFFQILGAGALHGRTFLPEEYRPGAARVVVLGHGLWQRRFGSDAGVIGRQLVLSGHPHTVVGVMPPEFDFPEGRELWAPRPPRERDAQNRGSTYLQVVARLKDGATLAQARADSEAVAARLAEEHPQTNAEVGVSVVPVREHLTGHVRPALVVLLAAVGLVLLIACANVASLLLARGAERRREFAVRAALGAGRGRLARQLFTESALLALLGGAGGVLLAVWGVDLILAFSPEGLVRPHQVALDARVLAFALCVSALTALFFGLVPSWQGSRTDLQDALKGGGRATSGGLARRRLHDALVVTEVALSLVLLVGAGLLVRSFVRLLRTDPGFATERVVALEAHVWGAYRKDEDRRNFFRESVERIAATPGVVAAGAASSPPFIQMDSAVPFRVEGRPAPPSGQEPSAYAITATPDYFRAMDIPVRRGRFFDRFDKEDAPPVVLINETMARRHWPGEDPVGAKIVVRDGDRPRTLEVVGVVGDTRHQGLDREPRPEFFRPHAQDPTGSMVFVARTMTDPAALLPEVRRQVWALNGDIAFDRSTTVGQLVSASLGQRRFTLLLVGSFATAALLLAAVGVYGLLSYTTRRRTREIGIRVALGARRGAVLRLVIGQGLRPALAGVCVGLLASAALTRLMSGLLYGVSATDPLTFAAVPLVFAVVALTAAYLPARRATKIDPMEALKYE